jgi:hypothetical protein
VPESRQNHELRKCVWGRSPHAHFELKTVCRLSVTIFHVSKCVPKVWWHENTTPGLRGICAGAWRGNVAPRPVQTHCGVPRPTHTLHIQHRPRPRETHTVVPRVTLQMWAICKTTVVRCLRPFKAGPTAQPQTNQF